MSLSSPHRTTGELITASIWNTDLVDALNSIQVSTDGTAWVGRLTADTTQTGATNQSVYGHVLSAQMNKAASGTHPAFLGTVINAPVIAGGGAALTFAASLVINAAPTVAASNYALYVAAGASAFNGTISLTTAISAGIVFSDTLETGLIGGSVAGFLGSYSNQVNLRSTLDVPVAIGVNNATVLTVGNGTSLPNLVIDQAAADGECLALRSSDVAHGFTTDTDAASYATFRKIASATGGLIVGGYGEAPLGLMLHGNGAGGDTGKTTAAVGAMLLQGAKLTGTTRGLLGANENILVIRNFDQTKFIFDAEGDLHFDGATPVAYDEWDDIALVRAMDIQTGATGVIESEWDRFVAYNRADLVRAGILSDGGMVNMTRHMRLLNGAVWQLGVLIHELRAEVADLRARGAA